LLFETTRPAAEELSEAEYHPVSEGIVKAFTNLFAGAPVISGRFCAWRLGEHSTPNFQRSTFKGRKAQSSFESERLPIR